MTTTASELLARAFHQDPFLSWAEPDPARRPRTLATVFAATLRYSSAEGGVCHEEGVGAVDWRDAAHAHVGVAAALATGAWRAVLVAPPTVLWRLSAHEDEAMERVARFLGPGTAYLSTLGVDPALAGQGHGSRLLRRALAAQVTRWSRCVLRTEQPRNVPFYQRHGFELVDEHVVRASGLPTFVFTRALEPYVPRFTRAGRGASPP